MLSGTPTEYISKELQKDNGLELSCTASSEPVDHVTGSTDGNEQKAHLISRVHVPSLDGVRGIAILLVIAYHFSSSLIIVGFDSPLLKVFRIGWCGVDVFFALSGFLITGILLDSKATPNYFRDIYARRFLRIFPLYYGSLLVVLLLRMALPGAGIWGNLQDGLASPGSLLWPSIFLQNFAIFAYGPSVTGVTTHYWSLAVEEHFYLFWPLLIWLATRRQALLLAIALMAGSIVIRTLLYLRGANLDAAFGLTPLRLDGLAIGAIASMAVRAYGIVALQRFAWAVLIAAGGVVMCLPAIRHSMNQTDPAIWIIGFPLVAMATAAMLLLGMAEGRFSVILSWSPLRWFGKYSFGLYVWHPIIGMLMFHSSVSPLSGGSGKIAIALTAVGALLLDLVCAWLSYQLWEKRFLDLKRYFAPGATTPAKFGPYSGLDGSLKSPAIVPPSMR